MTGIIKKILRVFVAFLSFFIVLGFLMFLVRDYSTPIVSAVNATNGGAITKTYNLTGSVVARNTIEIKAPKRMYVDEVNVENTQIVDQNFPLIRFDVEKLNDKVKADLQINDAGAYMVDKKIYIEYINEKDVIEEGEVIIKYSVHDMENLQIEVRVEGNMIYRIASKNSKIYCFKNDYNQREKVRISEVKDFPDYSMVYFPLNEDSNEKIKIKNTVNIIVDLRYEFSAIAVPVTSLIPIGEIGDDTNCYIYCIVEEDTILGKQNRVILRDAYVYLVGSSMAAIEIDNKDNKISNFSNLQIVNYATAAIKDGSRVRVK